MNTLNTEQAKSYWMTEMITNPSILESISYQCRKKLTRCVHWFQNELQAGLLFEMQEQLKSADLWIQLKISLNWNEFNIFVKFKFHPINSRFMLSDIELQAQVKYHVLKSALGIFCPIKILINFKIKNWMWLPKIIS